MFKLSDKDLRDAPFSLVKAIALSLARDIDRGDYSLVPALERVMAFAKTARVAA